jgi:hypothetical protein
MNEAVISTNVIDLSAYRAARAAKRFRALPTSYRLWDPSVGHLGHDTIAVPALHEGSRP